MVVELAEIPGDFELQRGPGSALSFGPSDLCAGSFELIAQRVFVALRMDLGPFGEEDG